VPRKIIIQSMNFSGMVWIIVPLALMILAYTERLVLDPALLPKFVTFSLFLCIFGIFILKKNRQSAFRMGSGYNGITTGLFVYVIAGALSLVYSTNAADGFFDWLKMVLLLAFTYFLSLRFENAGDYNRKLSFYISIFAIAASVPGIYQLADIAINGTLDHQSTYLVTSVFANRNLYAEVLLLTIPFSFSGIIAFKGFLRLLCAITLMISVIIITGLLVRSVWVAASVSVFATFIVFLMVNSRNLRKSIMIIPRKILWLTAGAVVILGFTIVLLYGRSGSIEQITKQTSFISNPYYGSSKDRFDLWERSYKIIKAHPISGTGIGTWKIEQLQFNEQGTLAEDAVTFYQSPHNDFIWIASEMGIAGILSYIFIFGAAAYYLVMILIKLRGRPESIFYYLVFFALCAYVVISNFGFPRERIEQQVLLGFILSSILTGYYSYVKKEAGKNRSITPALPVWASLTTLNLLLITAFIFGTLRLISEMHIRNAFVARAAGNQETVIKEMDEAESFVRHIDPLSTPLSWYSGSAYFISGEMDHALQSFSNAYKYNPYHVHVLNNYASVLEVHGRHAEAINLYRKALKINPGFDDALINLCAIYYNTGHSDSAYLTLRKVNPQCTDPRYRQSIKVVIPAALTIILNRTSEDFLKDYIFKIRNDTAWYTDIHFKAIKNNLTLQNQCILDIIYIMGNNKTLPAPEIIQAIKTKYQNTSL
jgi:O-antigen ligase